MNHQQRVVYGGVDTHQDVHVAAVIDEIGTLLATKSFPTSPLGLKGLHRWLTRHGRVAKVGVEGTGSYGLGLQRVLADAGHSRWSRSTGRTGNCAVRRASPTPSTPSRPPGRCWPGTPPRSRRPMTVSWKRSGWCWSPTPPAGRPCKRSTVGSAA